MVACARLGRALNAAMNSEGTVALPFAPRAWTAGEHAQACPTAGKTERSGESSFRVVISTEGMQRHVGLITEHPRVVRLGRDVEQVSGAQFDHPAVRECRGGSAGDDEPDVLDVAPRLPETTPHVLGPTPARLVSSAAHRHTADPHELEPPECHCTNFVRLLEAPENHGRGLWAHGLSRAATSRRRAQ